MREIFLKVIRIIVPETAVGFLVYGWLGAFLALHLSPLLPWLLAFVAMMAIYTPLWILASRSRERQIELVKFVRDVQVQLKAMEKDDGRTAVE